MARTPGNGVPVRRLLCVSACALGYGLTDAVFFTFLLQVLLLAGASRILAFMGIAAGAALSMIGAPLAAVLSTSINKRASITFGMLYFGAASCVALSYIFSKYALQIEVPTRLFRVYIGIALAGLYRAFVQASPIVPCVMDAAKTRGNDEKFPVRRDISLSCFYLLYRVGLVAASLAIAVQPRRTLDAVFPIMLIAAMMSLVLCAVSTFSFPREEKYREKETTDLESASDTSFDSESESTVGNSVDEAKKINAAKNSELPPVRSRFKEHIEASLFKADKRLLACYVSILFYGVAFGQLGAVTSCFFNKVIFNVDESSWRGVRWASYVALIGRGLSFILDAILPSLVFRKGARKFTMTIAWTFGAFIGSGIFFALVFVKDRWAGLILFSALDITSSTNNLFTLLSCGSLVLPKYRATSFSIRAGALNLGVLIGAAMGGFIAEKGGWRWVMMQSAVSCLASGFAAGFAGSVDRADYAGVAANANALLKYIFKKEQ